MQNTKGQVKMGIWTNFDGRYLTSPSGNTLSKMGGNLENYFWEKMKNFKKNWNSVTIWQKLPKKKLHLTLYVKVYKEPYLGWVPNLSSKLAWFLISFKAKILPNITWGPTQIDTQISNLKYLVH
jgi:hypothetical protein